MVASVVVLMATHDGIRWLDEQLGSILDQRGVDVRVVVFDDGSTDGTDVYLGRVAASDGRVHLLPPGRAGSASGAFYHLIKNAEVRPDEFVAFSDQDDVWMPGKLARSVSVLQRGIDGFSSNVTAVAPDGRRTLIRKAFPQREFDYLFEGPGPGNTFLLSPRLFELVRHVLVTDERARRIDFHDWLVYGVCRARGWRWHISEEPTVDYRQHDDNALGANAGLRSAVSRLRLVANTWHRGQSRLLAGIAADVTPGAGGGSLARLRRCLDSTSFSSRCRLARRFSQLRRRPRDRWALAAMIVSGLW